MKSIIKKAAAFCLSALTIFGAASCGSNDGPQKTKIGVLVADDSGEEALGFKNYLQNYVAKQYNVEFVYSAKLEDEATAKTTTETFVGQNCKAIIDMADKGRRELANYCNENKVYYAIGSGVMADADWEACKSLEYYVGQIGPSNSEEYKAGLAMGQAYASKTKIGLYGAFVPNPMHLYRLAGVITGLGNNYGGVTGEAIVGKVFSEGATFDAAKVAGPVEVKYFAGFDPDTIYGTLGAILGEGVESVLSVGMATTFFADMLNQAHMEYTDIDSFTAANGTNMKDGSLKYLTGKYSSSLGPIFAAIKRAVDGNALRDNGNAINLSKG